LSAHSGLALFTALQYPNYRLFFAGQAFANVASMMMQLTMGWLVYRLTDSVLMLGLVSFSREFSTVVMTLVAGVVADRYNKHRLLLLSHGLLMVATLLLSLLTLNGWISFPFVLAYQIFSGGLNGLEMPSRQALVNDLVTDKTHLTHAIALNSSLFNVARIVGPSVAGLMIPLVGEGWCFFICGIMSLCFVLFFRQMHYSAAPPERISRGFRAEFMEGIQYAQSSVSVRITMVFVAGITLLGVSYITVMPVFAHTVLQGDARTLGYLTSATGLGSILGAVYLSRNKQIMGIENQIFFGALLFAGCLILFALSTHVWLSLVALLLAGSGRVIVFAGSNTILQTITDPDKRGRVLSLYITLFMGGLTLGSLWLSGLSELVGAPLALALGGGCCLIITGFYGRNLGRFRRTTYRALRRSGAS
jgi:MFS family permease